MPRQVSLSDISVCMSAIDLVPYISCAMQCSQCNSVVFFLWLGKAVSRKSHQILFDPWRRKQWPAKHALWQGTMEQMGGISPNLCFCFVLSPTDILHSHNLKQANQWTINYFSPFLRFSTGCSGDVGDGLEPLGVIVKEILDHRHDPVRVSEGVLQLPLIVEDFTQETSLVPLTQRSVTFGWGMDENILALNLCATKVFI